MLVSIKNMLSENSVCDIVVACWELMGHEIESFNMTVDECVLRVLLIMKMWFRDCHENNMWCREKAWFFFQMLPCCTFTGAPLINMFDTQALRVSIRNVQF